MVYLNPRFENGLFEPPFQKWFILEVILKFVYTGILTELDKYKDFDNR